MDRDPDKIELAETAEADSVFLYEVYASTRADEVNNFGWDALQAEAFLRMQFAVRTRSYALQFPAAATYIVKFGGTPAGSMIVDSNNESVSLTDIAVLPAYRGKGIATHLIHELQNESAAAGKPLTLSVDKVNRKAFELYLSLGFIVVNQTDFNYSMKWRS